MFSALAAGDVISCSVKQQLNEGSSPAPRRPVQPSPGMWRPWQLDQLRQLRNSSAVLRSAGGWVAATRHFDGAAAAGKGWGVAAAWRRLARPLARHQRPARQHPAVSRTFLSALTAASGRNTREISPGLRPLRRGGHSDPRRSSSTL